MMKRMVSLAMLFILLSTTACVPWTAQEDPGSGIPVEEGTVPRTVFSGFIGEVNGVTYHVPTIPKKSFWTGEEQSYRIPTCEPFPILPNEGLVISSFCYYDGYVYYIEAEDKPQKFDTYLYRCKTDWTDVELVDEMIYNPEDEESEFWWDFSSRFFVIHDGNLYYSESMADIGKVFAIDLSTLERFPTEPIFFTAKERESYPNPLEYPVCVYNDMVFYQDSYKLHLETPLQDVLLMDNSAKPIGYANGYLYCSFPSKILPDTTILCRVPVQGGKKEYLAVRKNAQNGDCFFY